MTANPTKATRAASRDFTKYKKSLCRACTHVEPTSRRLGGCCFLALHPHHRKRHAIHRWLRAARHIPRLDHHLWPEPIHRQPACPWCSRLISIRLRRSLHDLRSRRLRLVLLLYSAGVRAIIACTIYRIPIKSSRFLASPCPLSPPP